MATPRSCEAQAGNMPFANRKEVLLPMKAWRICVPSWQAGPLALVMATTRGKAIARSKACANGVGYSLKWSDFKAARAPEFDSAYAQHGAFNWSYEHAMRMLKPNA